MKIYWITGYILLCVLFSCNDKKEYKYKTFYVEFATKSDSLLTALRKATSGKVSYYDNNKVLQVLSTNYITEEHPNMHYFQMDDERHSKPIGKSIKYQLTFNDSLSNDKLAYHLKKYVYVDNAWKERSDMGTMKVYDYLTSDVARLNLFYTNIAGVVIKNIATDSYDH